MCGAALFQPPQQPSLPLQPTCSSRLSTTGGSRPSMCRCSRSSRPKLVPRFSQLAQITARHRYDRTKSMDEDRTPLAGKTDRPILRHMHARRLQLHGIDAPGAPACSSTILISRLRCFHSLRLKCTYGGRQGDPDRLLDVPPDPLQGRNSIDPTAAADCNSTAAVHSHGQQGRRRCSPSHSLSSGGAPRHCHITGVQVACRLIALVVVQRHGARVWLACAGGRNANITQAADQRAEGGWRCRG